MTDKIEEKKESGLSWKMWTGIVASFLYAIAAICILVMNLCYSPPSPPLGLNGIGDYLAGAFSPLAFLWLVIGYLMQNKELKNNNESIKLQINELKSTTDLSNRNLNLQEEQWKIKKALDHNRAQPRLSCNESTFTVNSNRIGHYTVSTSIHNKGADISTLTIGLYSFQEMHLNKIKPVLIPTISRDSLEEVVFEFESDKDPAKDLIVMNIPIRYNDENNFSQTATLKMVLSLEGYAWEVSFDFLKIYMEPV
ncbi:hypothetical protein [Marinomonas primoryensis]|mgnify:CR=1 FL=1|uniref:hypothetical protein n=1 Tax=Marinomonas primoryensis TaxID=178399 RepID=UPI0030DCE2A5|tara:strand:+ start:11227 stop:11982 length:756 start_codon:yes stop_codon:yes gene_type:complete